jgi:Toprim domain-containing protein/uncharacterized protein DUF3991
MYDHELDRFKRDIPLVQFAVQRYGYVRDRRESSRACHVLRHLGSNDKIVVRQSLDGHWTYFSVRDSGDNGTIIDFVQARGLRSLREAREELRQYVGTPQPELDLPREAPQAAGDARSAAELFARARRAGNSFYLNERGIHRETLADARFADTWRIGPRENVFFAHRDDAGVVTGFEIKNRGFTGFATGGHKTAWQSAARPQDRALVITESAIDALSYHELHPEHAGATRYLSTAGHPSRGQVELLDRLLSRLPDASTVVAAVDADSAGETYARGLQGLTHRHSTLAFRRDAPTAGKDWNEVLQRGDRKLPEPDGTMLRRLRDRDQDRGR